MRALVTEVMKLRRSKVTWLSWLGYSIGPLAGALFMFILKEPGRAERLGLIGQKAQFAGESADWPTFLSLLVQMTGVAGPILLAIIAAYVFGREYADGTAKYLLALPVAREAVVAAKLVVVAAWFAILAVLAFAEGLALAALLDLPGLSTALVAESAGRIALIAGASLALMPVVAWIAVAGRSYLPPFGFAILTVFLGTVMGATGWGKWFPWSIVPLYAGVAGPPAEHLAAGSYAVLAATFAAGVAAVVLHVRLADNTQ